MTMINCFFYIYREYSFKTQHHQIGIEYDISVIQTVLH